MLSPFQPDTNNEKVKSKIDVVHGERRERKSYCSHQKNSDESLDDDGGLTKNLILSMRMWRRSKREDILSKTMIWREKF